MKNYKGYIFLLIGFVTLITACQKNIEKFPIDQVPLNRIFDPLDSNGVAATSYLNTVYSYILNGNARINDGNSNTAQYLDAASDDAVTASAASGNTVTSLSTGLYNSGTFANNISTTNDNLWAYYYAAIRQANIFITNIGVVPIKGQLPNGVGTRWQYQSEARFLRAMFYFELVKRYGGVPLIGDKVFNINDNLRLPRNTFSQCIKYIVSECDHIQDSLLTAPIANGLYGHATQAAALTLKAKVLLFAASDLYKPANNVATGVNANAAPFTGYTGADSTTIRWQAAANAANDVIKLGVFKLDTINHGRDVFLTQNNTEVIFARVGDNGHTPETNSAPVGYPQSITYGNVNPTQGLVDSYPMANGLAITNPASGYDAAHPYDNRDPRLANTVFFNGTRWLGTNVNITEGGQSKPNNNSVIQQTLSGYYMKKFMGYQEEATSIANHPEDWVIFRYVDILLGYAEAENELLGPNAQSYNNLVMIRERAGIPKGNSAATPYGIPVNASQDSIRQFIRNERRIEMAFEEQRWFDIKRWKIASDVLNKPRMGVIITNVNGQLQYSYQPILPNLFTSTAATSTMPANVARRYFYPIPYDEANKNRSLIQNPGW